MEATTNETFVTDVERVFGGSWRDQLLFSVTVQTDARWVGESYGTQRK